MERIMGATITKHARYTSTAPKASQKVHLCVRLSLEGLRKVPQPAGRQALSFPESRQIASRRVDSMVHKYAVYTRIYVHDMRP